MEALGPFLKTKMPGSHFKSTELETLRNGAQKSVILKSLPVTVKRKRKKKSGFPARLIKSKSMEVMPQDPTF